MTGSGTHPPPVASTTGAPPVAPAGSGPAGAAPAQRSRLDRMRGPLVTAGVVGVLTVALHFRDPHDAGSWGGCPWLALTGQYCPGCGGLRAVNDLGNGDLLGAASSNLVFVAMVPVLVLWWMLWAGRAWTGTQSSPRRTSHPGLWIAAFSLAMLVFTVVRNLPAGSWLAP